ncbi:MAG TPA: TlpA family protein disulfide reductase [Nitrospirae bacterium]|nr:TlpA family protein disulfide reductase [Nitrospirota bacterium]
MKDVLTPFLVLSMLLFSANHLSAEGSKAPEWVVSEWINGPGVSLADLRGKVVIVEFFQMWCPGCKAFSIPLMKRWSDATFKDEIESGKLKLLSIHTVFEGRDAQSPEKLKSFIKEKNIHHLVGIDAYKNGDTTPETMKKYGNGGTPTMAFIDKKGVIRFQRLGGFDPFAAEMFIRILLKEPDA